MQKECQIGSLANSPFWGKKGDLFFCGAAFFAPALNILNLPRLPPHEEIDFVGFAEKNISI